VIPNSEPVRFVVLSFIQPDFPHISVERQLIKKRRDLVELVWFLNQYDSCLRDVSSSPKRPE